MANYPRKGKKKEPPLEHVSSTWYMKPLVMCAETDNLLFNVIVCSGDGGEQQGTAASKTEATDR